MEDSILFIGPKFFGYEKEIVGYLEKRYVKVFYMSEFPFGGSLRYHILESLFGYKFVCWAWKKYAKEIKKIVEKNGIKKILIIRGMTIPEYLLDKLCKELKCKIIHYQWDSVKNNPNALIVSKYSFKNYTFDASDAQKYIDFDYLPLFYNWTGVDRKLSKEDIDILFVGSYTDFRGEIYRELKEFANVHSMSLKTHLYLPLPLYIRSLLKGNYIPLSSVKFRSMSKEKYYGLLINSKMVVDAPSPKQVGSSMRTIESLSLMKKIITTNVHVAEEKFYSPNNVLMWPDDINRIQSAIKMPFDSRSIDSLLPLEDWLSRMGV